MGNINSAILARSKLPKTQWTVLQHKKHCTVMRSQQSGLFADCYVIAMAPTLSLRTQMDMYKCRSQPNPNFVEVFHAQLLDTSTPHCFSYERTVKVLTEHIPFRLSDFSDLQEPDSLYIFSRALHSFKQLFEKLGYIQPTSQLICCNWRGEIKVWANDNLTCNHPKVRHEFMQRAATESDLMHFSQNEWQMIIKILECVERASKGGRIPQNFSATLRANRALTFNSAISMLEQFTLLHQITATEFGAFSEKKSKLIYMEPRKVTPMFPLDRFSEQSSVLSHRQGSIEHSSLFRPTTF